MQLFVVLDRLIGKYGSPCIVGPIMAMGQGLSQKKFRIGKPLIFVRKCETDKAQEHDPRQHLIVA